MLTLFSLLFAANAVATSSIHATIHGTNDPLIVSLLQRDHDLENEWHPITQRRIPASQRHVDLGGLAAGIYQVRVQRADGNEQVGVKVNVGAGETRSPEISVDPLAIDGSVALADVPLTKAVVQLRHADMQWSIALPVSKDGKFHA